MAELTKEWLLRTIAELEEERDAVPGLVNEDADKALAAMKLALASLEAEPVYQVFSFKRWRDVSEEVFEAEKKDGCQVRVLYTAPPETVSVPDAMDGQGGVCCEVSYADGWNSCLAAMLHGAEPVSNRDELTDGWVACSERMPEVRKPVYIFHPDYGVDQCAWYDHQEGAFVWGDETRLRELESVSHWMAMPKLPSTPRKEV